MGHNYETQQFKQHSLNYFNDALKEIKGFGDDVYLLDDQRLALLNVITEGAATRHRRGVG